LSVLHRGQNAIDALGTNLPEVARTYGLTAAELNRRLRTDSTLALDPSGRLLYTDRGPDLTERASQSDLIDSPQTVGPATADAFRLHSRPGSKRTLYLDFNGQLMSDNAWSDNYNGGQNIVAAPYDSDGFPNSFSETERTKIILIWQRVAEDYAPFDVDVTTELLNEALLTRSSSSDEYYGVRVLIAPFTSIFGNYGGISYVGTFNDFGDYYKPSLVFCDALGPNNDKNISEAASHEAGHALGLSHDGVLNGASYYSGNGSGETGWAPIMGVGYSKNLTQWSRGEYASANNTQDDLAVMQNYGISHRADDHGSTISAASYFPTGSQLDATGIIERSTDVDVFAFTAGEGPLTVSIAAQSPGPNLDIRAELRNSAGTLLATSKPADQLAASFNLSVPAGTYFLSVKGDGNGNPSTIGYSSYGSLGNYSISGTVVSSTDPVAPVAIATVNTESGSAPLAVTFDGSQSFDPDGGSLSYAWDFGDGTGESGAVVNHSYLSTSTYTASLRVTDTSGLTHSDSVSIQVVTANTPLTANIVVSATSGTTPLTVTFDGSGSTDSEGRLVSYAWNFGDGRTAQGSIVQTSFETVGTFQVSLVVTDGSGATATGWTTIVVRASTLPAVRVESIAETTTENKSGTIAWANIQVTDLAGNPIPGVSVSGRWTGPVNNGRSRVTDSNGIAKIGSKTAKSGSVMTFTLVKLALTGYTYDPLLNLQRTVTIKIP